MSVRTYEPPGTTVPFLLSDKFASFIVGPYGSGKTTCGLIKIATMARQVAPCLDGIRRSRCAVVRNTKPMLKDSTVPDFLKWFPDGEAGTFLRTDFNFILRFDDVECEVLFRGLDDTNDVRRLLSTQLTFGVMDEFREINKDIYEALAGRLGRYPDKTMVPPRPEWGLDEKGNPIGGCVTDEGKPAKRLWGMSNPPDMDTFWEQILADPPDNMHVTIQPSGVSPLADWVKWLDTGYYENLMELHRGDQDWIDIYVHGKFGASLSGKPVVPTFRSDIHVVDNVLFDPLFPLVVGFDPGLAGSAMIFGQEDLNGRLRVLGELIQQGYGAERLITDRLRPYLRARFPDAQVIIAPDPAAANRAQTNEKAVVDVFRKYYDVRYDTNNRLQPRLDAIEHYTTRITALGPALLVDGRQCPVLVRALRGGWRFALDSKRKNIRSGDPEKNEYSHPGDAFGYLCKHFVTLGAKELRANRTPQQYNGATAAAARSYHMR